MTPALDLLALNPWVQAVALICGTYGLREIARWATDGLQWFVSRSDREKKLNDAIGRAARAESRAADCEARLLAALNEQVKSLRRVVERSCAADGEPVP